MKIGFTGTRYGMKTAQQTKILELLDRELAEFHHGMCEGADTQAHQLIRNSSLKLLKLSNFMRKK